MTGIEISLLLIGCVFMVGSFFVSEKLSGTEINRLAELSDEELKRIIGKGMENANHQIEEVVEEKIEEASEKVEIAMERESNLKITAISEYSDTVFESMKRTHDEIMFLYSMLNDKHTELTSLTGDLQRLAANVRNLQESALSQIEAAKASATVVTVEPAMTQAASMVSYVEKAEYVEAETIAEEVAATEVMMETAEQISDLVEEEMKVENHNDMILALHKEGMNKVDIAKKLNLGVGEVSLVIGLYKGDDK